MNCFFLLLGERTIVRIGTDDKIVNCLPNAKFLKKRRGFRTNPRSDGLLFFAIADFNGNGMLFKFAERNQIFL